MLDVTRLRVLVAVARHGSVTAAARALNYAQPSVSHHLARLEAETGTQLTERSGRGIRLTGAGRLLADRAEEILGRLEAAEEELAAQVAPPMPQVRLAAFRSALATIVPGAAARLRAEHPGTRLLLTEAEPAEAARLLAAGQADVALATRYLQDGEAVYESSPVTGSGPARLILSEPVLLVTAGGAAGADSRPASSGGATGLLAALRQLPWIAGSADSRGYLLWACERAGFSPRIAAATDDHVAAQALVAAGLGVTILPELALRAARHPGITPLPLPGASRQVLALTCAGPPAPAAVDQLLGVLAGAGQP
ncbi:MAG: LysR family transcriptional regulator [Actinobacteria bacterium]|nr:LysR family transcriptional regulator [Actinomycetota bacterium]MBO0785224.1 LysR family transcriptional regulator [Actinomycetota bacterium]